MNFVAVIFTKFWKYTVLNGDVATSLSDQQLCLVTVYATGVQPSDRSVVSTLISNPYPFPNPSNTPSLYDVIFFYCIYLVLAKLCVLCFFVVVFSVSVLFLFANEDQSPNMLN